MEVPNAVVLVESLYTFKLRLVAAALEIVVDKLMFIAADQILLHLVGDYIIQSDWMAGEKTKKSVAAMAHAVTYTLPFLFLTRSPLALAFICLTHFVIDHWRLARYVCWIKNFVGPRRTLSDEEFVFWNGRVFSGGEHKPGDTVWSDGKPYIVLEPVAEDDSLKTRPYQQWWHPWSECVGTGYHKDRPAWLAVWLMIITDNIMHLILNGVALRYLV